MTDVVLSNLILSKKIIISSKMMETKEPLGNVAASATTKSMPYIRQHTVTTLPIQWFQTSK